MFHLTWVMLLQAIQAAETSDSCAAQCFPPYVG